MQKSSVHVKPLAKKAQKSKAPVPDLITQVSKEDDEAPSTSSFARFSSCCKTLWKCLSFKGESNFEEIEEPSNHALLEPQLPQFKGRKVLVLDLDETLVHSTFEPVTNADLVLPVHIQGMTYKINVIIRPGCEEFLARMGELYEVVVFTASLAEYAEPLCRNLDTTNAISSILYRQHCTPLNGVYVKDMALLGRDMKDIILVDNSPNSFLFQPENAYHIKNFFDDKTDRELDRLTDFLERILHVPDVRPIEDLRREYEPQHQPPKNVKFVKVNHQVPDQEDSTTIIKINPVKVEGLANKKKEEKKEEKREEIEKPYYVETEPDLRRENKRTELYQLDPTQPELDDLRFGARSGAVTDRGAGKDRLMDSDYDIELPSPKESDKLIYHENNKKPKRPFVPPLAKDKEAFGKLTRGQEQLVVVEDHMIDGQKVEDVRMLTGFGNLNSPLGRHVEIVFNGEDKNDSPHSEKGL